MHKNKDEFYMSQASGTVISFMIEMRNKLDELFGPDFIAENPAVWQSLVHSCVEQYRNEVLSESSKQKRI